MIIISNLKCIGAKCAIVASNNDTNNEIFLMLSAGNTVKIKITFDRAAAINLSDFVAWKIVIDKDYDRAPKPLYCAFDGISVNGEQIIADLWLDSAALRSEIGTKEQIKLYCELTGYTAGETMPGLTLQFPFTLLNRLDLDTVEPTTGEQGNFYNRAQTDALLAAVDTAQVATVTKYQPEIAGLEFSEELGYYKALTAPGDTLRLVYNATECVSLALRVRSASPAITGTVAVAIKANGATVQSAAFPTGAEATWHEVSFDEYVNGVLTVELISGLTDGGAPVSVIVDGVRLVCKLVADTIGHVERQVAAGPLCYSDADGYTLRLDADYSVNLKQPVNGLLAVALRLKSANPAITGNIAVTLTTGGGTKTEILPVGAAAAWRLITLDAPASGAAALVRDTANAADTLKDGDATVSAVVEDINYLYQE